MTRLDEYLNGLRQLPPAPRVIPELLALLREDDVDSARVVAVIGYDPGLTASVLQLCNSAYFGLATPASDLGEAVTRLGFNPIFRMVVSVVGARTLNPEQKGYGIGKGELWKHSLASAVAAQLVARKVGESESLVYTAALLHDIGKIALNTALERVYGKVIEETERNRLSLIDSEKALLGMQHAEIGARLLSRWHFPESLVEAVGQHHSPEAADAHRRLAALVYVGNMLSHFMGYGCGDLPFALHGRAEALDILELKPDALPHFMIETFEKIAMIDSLFRVAG